MCPSQPKSDHAASGTTQRNSRRPHILLVEDDADHRLIAEHYLKKVGDRIGPISHAFSLKSATEALNELDIDVVLLDLTLPDSTFEETLAALVNLTRQYDSRFVALSSLSTADVARKAVENGAASFLGKQDFSASVFRELLDELGFTAELAETSKPGVAAPPVKRGAHPAHDAKDILGAEPRAPIALASQIAHDAMSWASNVTFRTRAMSADPAIQASKELQDGLASIRESADALTSFISGARSLLMAELELESSTTTETDEVALATWLATMTERWKKSSRDKRLDIRIEVDSSVRLPRSSGVRLLQQTFAAILHNVRQHAARSEGPVTVTLRETKRSGSNVTIEVIDDGGPWELGALTAQGATLGSPLGTGKKKSPSAGLGLFIASRTLQALGGSLTTSERDDESGAYAIRIELPRA